MTEAEQRYSKMKKIVLALIQAKRKLKHYFEVHLIIVPTKFPIRAILHKPDQSRRMVEWAIKLEVHEITYEPQTAIKGQVVADFLLECEPESDEEAELPNDPKWKLFVDVSSMQSSSGIGVEIQTLDGTTLQQAIHLEFPTSNNEAECEALLAGLRLAQTL